MVLAIVRGITLNYEIIGDRGPAMALTPGGRNPLANVRAIAERMAAAGYRVLIHDRRNCGASDVAFEADTSEYDSCAADLHDLLKQLDMLPAIVGGSSSGARLALAFALRYPKDTKALLLWRVTGGAFAVKRLTEKYYDEFIRAAESGGMAAVCATEHFAELIRTRPSNRERLMAIEPKKFVALMQIWRKHFVAGADYPLIGASEAELRGLTVPTCIVPGNDLTHPGPAGTKAGALMPNAEVHVLFAEQKAVDVVPPEEWKPREADMTKIFADFLASKSAKT
jgi:pimeloyl-ACP methyl ester carboxylesterase